jgi:hypothetical protein
MLYTAFKNFTLNTLNLRIIRYTEKEVTQYGEKYVMKSFTIYNVHEIILQ